MVCSDLPSPSQQHLHLVTSNRGATEVQDLGLSWEVFTLSLAAVVSSTCGHKVVGCPAQPSFSPQTQFPLLYFSSLLKTLACL